MFGMCFIFKIVMTGENTPFKLIYSPYSHLTWTSFKKFICIYSLFKVQKKKNVKEVSHHVLCTIIKLEHEFFPLRSNLCNEVWRWCKYSQLSTTLGPGRDIWETSWNGLRGTAFIGKAIWDGFPMIFYLIILCRICHWGPGWKAHSSESLHYLCICHQWLHLKDKQKQKQERHKA